MTLSCFTDKAVPPDAGATHGPLAHEWAFAGQAFGWSLRLRQPKRVLLYLIPGSGSFLAGVVLGGKAAAAALADATLPAALRQPLAAARVYAEGRGIRLELRGASDLPPVLRLLEHKTRC